MNAELKKLLLDVIDHLDVAVIALGAAPTYLEAAKARTACREASTELDRLIRRSAALNSSGGTKAR